MRIVDLRSDTITKPTQAMRAAMAEAEVGDDVFGEDPTINRLEEMAAERMGKPASLFVSSGTMGNLVSLLTHCGRGDEVILGDQAHIFFNEQGGCAALGGIQPRTVPNQPDGKIALSDITAAIRSDNIHFPRTRLIALENTHNRCYGAPLDVDYMAQIKQIAKQNRIKIHVDGARIFHAAIALGVDTADLAHHADSITFCLSKGLAAPVGSVVCGDTDFITEARRNRKVLGGGMRQAGILAAAGIVALSEMVDRLADDHETAKQLANGLAAIDGISINPELVQTNIVFFGPDRDDITAEEIRLGLAENGVRVLQSGPKQLRAVTNYHIAPDDVDYALGVFNKVIK